MTNHSSEEVKREGGDEWREGESERWKERERERERVRGRVRRRDEA